MKKNKIKTRLKFHKKKVKFYSDALLEVKKKRIGFKWYDNA
jgi:hypothetical protein